MHRSRPGRGNAGKPNSSGRSSQKGRHTDWSHPYHHGRNWSVKNKNKNNNNTTTFQQQQSQQANDLLKYFNTISILNDVTLIDNDIFYDCHNPPPEIGFLLILIGFLQIHQLL